MHEVVRWWSVPAAASLLMLPALINGYPLIFPDTALYIHQGIYLTASGPWAMGYALFLRPFAQMGTLWPAIAVQALAATWAIQRLRISFGANAREPDIIFLIVLLAMASTLPWTVSWVLPDIFMGLLILSIAALVSSHLAEDNGRDWLFIGLAVICSVMHASSILLLISLSTLILILANVSWIWMASRRRNLHRLSASIGIVLVLGIAANLVINGVIHRRISVLTPYGSGLALAALNQSGLVTPYLDANCAKHRYRLCQFKDSLLNDPAAFLFWPNSPFNVLGGFKGMDDEARQIVLDIVVQQPTQITTHIFRTLKSQIARLDVREEMGWAMENPGVLAVLEMDGILGLDQYRNALQHSGHFPSSLMFSIHRFTVFASIGLLLVFLSLGAKLLKWNQVGGTSIILIGILLNDLFSAAISTPQARYQTRVIWLLPTVVILLLLSAAQELRSLSRSVTARPGHLPVSSELQRSGPQRDRRDDDHGATGIEAG
jgi:hypothetical protein